MPNIPCPVNSPCDNPANPITNYTSEKPDLPVFLGFSSGAPLNTPNPGQPWTNPSGYFYCRSTVSQADANLCADNGAGDNGDNNGGTGNNGDPNTGKDPGNPGGPSLFSSSAQTCSVLCPDGNSFDYTLPAGAVKNNNPTLVDRIALSLACQRANEKLICISDVSNACLGEEYEQSISVGNNVKAPVTWLLVSGMLPPGLDIEDDFLNTRRIFLVGTPTLAGNFSFVLQAADADGNFMNKAFTLGVMDITNTPPGATAGVVYNFQFTADGGTTPYTFSIVDGSLPAGLTMSASGKITGTPTTQGTSTFKVEVEDSNGVGGCQKEFTINTAPGNTCPADLQNISWGAPSLFPVSAPFSISGPDGSFGPVSWPSQPSGGSGQLDIHGTITNSGTVDYVINVSAPWSGTTALPTTFSLGIFIDGGLILSEMFNNSFSSSPSVQFTLLAGQSVDFHWFISVISGAFNAGSIQGQLHLTCV